MSDSGKGPIGGTFEDIGEAVVKPVSDGVGQMIEAGIQSVMPNQPSAQKTNNPQPTPQPQDSSIKTPEEQKKIQELQFYIKRQKETSDAVEKVRREREQKQTQVAQNDQQEKKIKQFEISKKQQKNVALEQAQKRTEVRGGVGG